MIDIKKLTEEDKGKWVVYKTEFKEEQGRIKSWNDKYIFVVYNCGNNWANYTDYTAASTSPEDLTFLQRRENMNEKKIKKIKVTAYCIDGVKVECEGELNEVPILKGNNFKGVLTFPKDINGKTIHINLEHVITLHIDEK